MGALQERIKELSCLYEVVRLAAEQQDGTLEEILQGGKPKVVVAMEDVIQRMEELAKSETAPVRDRRPVVAAVVSGVAAAVCAILFTIGVLGVLLRRNVIVVFMSVELMLTAVNLSLISFSRAMGDMHGHVFVLFIFAVAAAEAGIGLAILVEIFRKRDSVDVDEFRQLME